MNKNFILNFILVLTLNSPALLMSSPISDQESVRLELILNQMEDGQTKVWPTLNWKAAPLIVTFESGHIFALNLHSQDSAWETLSLGNNKVLTTKNDPWGLLDIQMQSNFAIEGQSAFVYKMKLSNSPEEDVILLAHERFHRHQSEYFTMREPQGVSSDHLDEENLVWSEIEDDLLREFLSAEGVKKEELLKDYVAVNQMRMSAVDPETELWEKGQLRMEGLADYTSTKGFGGEKWLLQIHPLDQTDDDFVDNAIKWRHYLAGASLGYALDFLAVDNWKARVEQGEALTDILAQALPLSNKEIKDRLVKIQERLKYKKRRLKVSKRLEKYHKDLDDLHQGYEKRDGIRLWVHHPRKAMSGGGANDRMAYLREGGTVNLNDASIATTSDAHWRFETVNVPHLFMHLNGSREVKLGLDSELIVDNVSLKMSELMTCPKEFLFETLQIDGTDLHFTSKNQQGILIADEEGVSIHYPG